jgi:hypothetical protein
MQLTDGVCQKHRPLVFLAALLLVKKSTAVCEISGRPINNVLCKIKLVYVKFSKFCIE